MNSKPSISDSHCHLDFPDFNEDLSEVINAALENGVNRMVTICTRLRNEPSVRKMSEDYEAIYYAAVNHPMSVSFKPMAHLTFLENLISLFYPIFQNKLPLIKKLNIL